MAKIINQKGKIEEKPIKRIIYVEKEPNIFLSKLKFIGEKGGVYEIELNTERGTYKVRNIRRKTIIRSTEKDGRKAVKNLRYLKEQAKKALATLGVKLDIEVRLV